MAKRMPEGYKRRSFYSIPMRVGGAVAVLNHWAIELWDWAEGRSTAARLAEVTTVSERTWRDGGPKRPAARARAEAEIRDAGVQRFKGMGWTVQEAMAILESSRGPCENMAVVCALNAPGGDPGFYVHTLEIARRIDSLSTEIQDRYRRDGTLAAAKQALDCPWLERAHFCEEKEFRGVHEPAAQAKLRSATAVEIESSLKVVMWNLLCSFLAHLDLEFTSRYFEGAKAVPLFLRLMPRFARGVRPGPNGTLTRFPGMILQPMRLLIQMMDCLGYRICKGAWPDGPRTVRQLGVDSGTDELWLVSIRDGTTELRIGGFRALWSAFSLEPNRRGKDAPRATPLPMYLAALVWSNLLTQVDTRSRAKRFIVGSAGYDFWWRKHRAELEAAGVVRFGPNSWPRCLLR